MNITVDADHADEIFKKLRKLISEGLLRFTEDGLKLTTADPATVAMIDLEIPEDSFNEYEVNPEDHENLKDEDEEMDGVMVGLDIENLHTVIKLFDDEINLSIEENELILEEEDDRFELPILNLSTNDIPSMGNLDGFNIKGELDNDDFKSLRKKLEVAADSTTLTVTEEGVLKVEGGGDQISVESETQLEDAETLDEVEDDVSSMYALEYLSKAQKMFSSLETCDSLELQVGNDFPLKMVHEDSRENLTFILAPRIEER